MSNMISTLKNLANRVDPRSTAASGEKQLLHINFADHENR